MTKNTVLKKVVIKFAGDSGDGMQFTGSQFTETAALLGNDLATFPDFPAEIRAPRGSVAGVSGFQVHIGEVEINTPGDKADVLVAMNAAALKSNLRNVKNSATIIVDTDNFSDKDVRKAGFESNPLENDFLNGFHVVEAPISRLTRDALKYSGLDGKSIMRCKNMFALGIVYWMFNRPLDYSKKRIEQKFSKSEPLIKANILALQSGFNYAETIEVLNSTFEVLPAKIESGTYRNIVGNQALAWGFLAASEKSGLPLFLGSYPITPASDILHELAKYKSFGVRIFQAEDEIAGICAAIGASFAGGLGVTTTSGPGLALKSEAIGLAVSAELPIVVVDVQRGGPSTGLPTKTEQADLSQALYGRNGESPVAVLAASTPSGCFRMAYEACKIAVEHMSPVILLSDGYLGNGSEPWKITKTDALPDIRVNKPSLAPEAWTPYVRDENTLARDWAIPGEEGYEHRIGGLEKEDVTGKVSYDPDNHQKMVNLRKGKIDKIQNSIPELEVIGAQKGDLLVVGWGGTFGTLYSAVLEMNDPKIGLAHFEYIQPLPSNTMDVFKNFKNILVCELNTGQFAKFLRSSFSGISIQQYNKVQGQPFNVAELKEVFQQNSSS